MKVLVALKQSFFITMFLKSKLNVFYLVTSRCEQDLFYFLITNKACERISVYIAYLFERKPISGLLLLTSTNQKRELKLVSPLASWKLVP